MSFNVKFYVNPIAAIKAGNTDFGLRSVEVAGTDLADAALEIRNELASVVVDNSYVGNGFTVVGKLLEDLPATQATPQELFRLLAHRAVKRAEVLEAYKKQQDKDRSEEARRNEELAVRKREDEAKAAKRMLAVQKWVAKNGTDNQKARFKEGMLPEGEVFEAIAEYLCEDLNITATNEVYRKIAADDVCGCSCVDDVEFSVTQKPPLTAEQYDTLTQAREDVENLGDNFAVVPLLHRAHCPTCDCAPVEKLSLRFEMEWEDVPVVREFAL